MGFVRLENRMLNGNLGEGKGLKENDLLLMLLEAFLIQISYDLLENSCALNTTLKHFLGFKSPSFPQVQTSKN